MKKSILTATLLTLSIPAALATTVVIDDHFDDGTVTGWSSLGNNLGATHNITESGTTLTSEVIATQPNQNTHRGIVSTTSFDPAAESGGFTMTFVVSSQGVPGPGANGMFLGATTGTTDPTEFYRSVGVDSFGLSLFGHPVRTQSDGGVSLSTNDIGSGGSIVEGLLLDANPNSIQLASLQDGFTATLGADLTGWSFSVTGINDTGGTPTTIADSGTWAAAGSTFAAVFGGSTDWHALASNQGVPGTNSHTLVIDQISVSTIPEPSSALFGLLGLALIFRRRRS